MTHVNGNLEHRLILHLQQQDLRKVILILEKNNVTDMNYIFILIKFIRHNILDLNVYIR